MQSVENAQTNEHKKLDMLSNIGLLSKMQISSSNKNFGNLTIKQVFITKCIIRL